jgi:hypothetical protein
MVCLDMTSSIKVSMFMKISNSTVLVLGFCTMQYPYRSEENLHVQRERIILPLAHILDAAVTPVGKYHFGALAGGYMSISADLRPMNRSPIPAHMHLIDCNTTFVQYDDTYSNKRRQVFDGAYFLVLSCVVEISVRVRGLV